MKSTILNSLTAVLLFLAAPASRLDAQDSGPPRLSTNPARHVIFPAKNQTPEQQAADELAAYDWATRETGWDPYQASASLQKSVAVAQADASSTRGQAVGGTARGAILGLAIGAAAGDAEKGAAIGATAGGLTAGMRGRQNRGRVEAESSATADDYQEKFRLWDKHFIAAMEGKGYTVK